MSKPQPFQMESGSDVISLDTTRESTLTLDKIEKASGFYPKAFLISKSGWQPR